MHVCIIAALHHEVTPQDLNYASLNHITFDPFSYLSTPSFLFSPRSLTNTSDQMVNSFEYDVRIPMSFFFTCTETHHSLSEIFNALTEYSFWEGFQVGTS